MDPVFSMEKIIKNIAKKECAGEVVGLKNLSLGWSGSSVYVAEIKNNEVVERVIIKTGSSEPEVPFKDEPDNRRVYGGRFSNLEPAYRLMIEHNIRVPKLLAKGTEGNLPYVTMEFLEGDTQVPELIVADELGKLHRITRNYQGCVSMERPYAKSWKDAFFSAIRAQLETASNVSTALTNILPQANHFLDQMESEWEDPSRFVLSHTDGFQGIAKQTNGVYEFMGVIDLEDHQFTDQRFVLAGYELLSELWMKKTVSQQFWDIYKKYAQIEPTHGNFRNLFQLYYLLDWLPSYHKRTDDPEMGGYISATEKLIADLVSNHK